MLQKLPKMMFFTKKQSNSVKKRWEEPPGYRANQRQKVSHRNGCPFPIAFFDILNVSFGYHKPAKKVALTSH